MYRFFLGTLLTGARSRFEMGFHAVPSLKPLHLHVITQDFIGDGLKKKSHYNSFTTPFFVKIDDAIAILSDAGKIHVRSPQFIAGCEAAVLLMYCYITAGQGYV